MKYSDLKKLEEKVEILHTVAFHLESQAKQKGERSVSSEYQDNLGKECHVIYRIIRDILEQ
jgi:hypothetical protein